MVYGENKLDGSMDCNCLTVSAGFCTFVRSRKNGLKVYLTP